MGEARRRRVGLLALAIILVALLWPLAYFGSDWAVYWGCWLLSVLFALTITYLRTRYFWEE